MRHHLEPSRPDRGSRTRHRRGRSDPNWDAATTFGGVAPLRREDKPNGQNPVSPLHASWRSRALGGIRLGLTLLAAGPALNPHYSYCVVRDSQERRPRPAPVTTEVSRRPSKRPCCARQRASRHRPPRTPGPTDSQPSLEQLHARQHKQPGRLHRCPHSAVQPRFRRRQRRREDTCDRANRPGQSQVFSNPPCT